MQKENGLFGLLERKKKLQEKERDFTYTIQFQKRILMDGVLLGSPHYSQTGRERRRRRRKQIGTFEIQFEKSQRQKAKAIEDTVQSGPNNNNHILNPESQFSPTFLACFSVCVQRNERKWRTTRNLRNRKGKGFQFTEASTCATTS